MVTVGNRLKYELHEDFLNEIKRILAQPFVLSKGGIS